MERSGTTSPSRLSQKKGGATDGNGVPDDSPLKRKYNNMTA